MEICAGYIFDDARRNLGCGAKQRKITGRLREVIEYVIPRIPIEGIAHFGISPLLCDNYLSLPQVLRARKGVLSLYSSYSPRYQAFLERLRQARVEAGLTQVQVAEKLGKGQTFISKCELGQRRVDFVELQMFAQIYGKPPDFFAQ